MDNIILISMPGVGKSTLGVLLLQNPGHDLSGHGPGHPGSRRGPPPQDLIAARGIGGFLDLEGSMRPSQAHPHRGGHRQERGLPLPGHGHLRELSTQMVYLKLGYRALAKRLGSLKRRGGPPPRPDSADAL